MFAHTRARKSALTLLLLAALLLQAALPASAADSSKKAYNIYADPIFSGSTAFDGFSIDFQSSDDGICTFWSLASFKMDTSGSKGLYPDIKGDMGAYAGLQVLYSETNRVAIMSFWEVDIGGGLENGSGLRATRLYPTGDESGFGGEGEGNNYKGEYAWEANHWYRMVLRCWDSEMTGTTLIGQWFQDLESGEWTLISVFDTKLKNSYMKGDLSQFMENFSSYRAEIERSFQYKNYYALDHETGVWKRARSVRLSYDSSATDKRGEHEFGLLDDGLTAWGRTNGALPEGITQEEYNAASRPLQSFQLKQPLSPDFASPALGDLTLSKEESGWALRWSTEENAPPQLTASAVVYDGEGNRLGSASCERPDNPGELSLGNFAREDLRAVLTYRDVCAGEITREVATPAYIGTPGDLDRDGSANIADVGVIVANIAAGEAYDLRADLTGDGAVSIKDATRLLQMLGGE